MALNRALMVLTSGYLGYIRGELGGPGWGCVGGGGGGGEGGGGGAGRIHHDVHYLLKYKST